MCSYIVKPGFDFLGYAWGKPEPKARKVPTLDELYLSEWCNDFEQKQRNRLVMGYFRYGPLWDTSQVGKYDNVGSIRQRLAEYEKDGNLEHLVDCANYCVLEYVKGTHPKRHFAAQDDVIHTKEKRK